MEDSLTDRMLEQFHNAVDEARQLYKAETPKDVGIILVGNPADPKVAQIADAYRDLGIVVFCENCHQTRAIGGREFHTIVVDELLDERLNLYTEAYRKQIATVGHTIVENTLKEIYTPKNQPHGPLRKGRGGKLRRW